MVVNFNDVDQVLIPRFLATPSPEKIFKFRSSLSNPFKKIEKYLDKALFTIASKTIPPILQTELFWRFPGSRSAPDLIKIYSVSKTGKTVVC